jgi:hypothetical protein
MREILGFILAIVALLIATGGVWAASYYSPRRKYSRMRARERRAVRERTSMAEMAGHRDESNSPIEANADTRLQSSCAEAREQVNAEGTARTRTLLASSLDAQNC